MRKPFNWRIPLAMAAVLLLGFAATADAQLRTGNIHGTVIDTTTGAALPGVTVTVSGVGPTLHQITDGSGNFRFVGLAPGTYRVEARLDGFSPVVFEAAAVRVGHTTSIELRMNPAIEETITVTAESPLLDERKIVTGATVTQVELEKIPTARDPWAILQSVPGVLTDRINVGGIEAGEQSVFTGPGSGAGSSEWYVDGVRITDPAARGSSPTYYDFENFEEMQFSTGGTEITGTSGGVHINLVTRRGTNEWRGSARGFRADSSWQSDPDVSVGDFGQAGPWNRGNAQSTVTKTNQVEQVDEYGLELGGPIVQDRLWIWGSYGVVDVEKFAVGATPEDLIPDNTELENIAAKLNWQITPSSSAVGFYHFGDKVKTGRGAAPNRPAPTTWNQSGPTDVYKLEATHVFGANLFATAFASYVDGGFALTPQGGFGPDAPNIDQGPGGVWANTFFHYETERPQDQITFDANYFFDTGTVNHELRFGAGYRKSTVDSITVTPGDGILGLSVIGPIGPPGAPFLGVVRQDHIWSDEFEQYDIFAQDTMSFGNLTATVGLRYDRQVPHNLAVTNPASRAVDPATGQPILEALSRPASDPGFRWETISPRVGLTWALGAERRTLLRASYSRYSDHLTTGLFGDLGPNLWYRYGYVYFDFDATGNPDPSTFINAGVHPPRDLNFSANSVDPGFDPFTTDEVILGIEHALLPELVVSGMVTWRQDSDVSVNDRYVIDAVTGERRLHRRSDYHIADHVVGTLPDGTPFRVPHWTLNDEVATLDPQRGLHTRNSGIGRDYLGFSFGLTKRLANRWMARGHVTWSDWSWDIPGHEVIDPNIGVNSRDGDQVLVQSLGSGNRGEVWMNSRWSANLSGLYQVAPDLPWGFNIGADLFARQGFAIPYRVSILAAQSPDPIGRTILVAPSNTSFRADDVYNMNLRLEKPFDFGEWGLSVSADIFNVFNDSTVLQREGLVSADYEVLGTAFNQSRSDFVREAVSPRIFRLGARVTFR